MRLSPRPCAIAASVLMLHGTTIMPSVRNDPLEIAAPWSASGYTRVAIASTSSTVWAVSCTSVRAAHRLRTRCASTSVSCSICRTRTPKIVPVAPVIATMTLRGGFSGISPFQQFRQDGARPLQLRGAVRIVVRHAARDIRARLVLLVDLVAEHVLDAAIKRRVPVRRPHRRGDFRGLRLHVVRHTFVDDDKSRPAGPPQVGAGRARRTGRAPDVPRVLRNNLDVAEQRTM